MGFLSETIHFLGAAAILGTSRGRSRPSGATSPSDGGAAGTLAARPARRGRQVDPQKKSRESVSQGIRQKS